MKTEESLSNDSLGDGRYRFNGSSVSSAPENDEPSEGKFIEFEEYGSGVSAHPKSSKIRID